ncbi:hypothetical protein I4U23_005302 [Adineta vaga]|nr:hypothetical protein I4U23_005302 [Adineta vaga]
MFNDNEITPEVVESISIKLNHPVQHAMNIPCLNVNKNVTTISYCARGKLVRARPIFTHFGFNKNQSTTAYECKEQTDIIDTKKTAVGSEKPLDIVCEDEDRSTDKDRTQYDIERDEQDGIVSHDEHSSILEDRTQYDIERDEQDGIEYEKKDQPIHKNQTQNTIKRRCLSRFKIQQEIINMIKNVLSNEYFHPSNPLYMCDAHCYFDVLFEKLKCPDQSIWCYIEHNSELYDQGIDMKYIIQCYFAPRHFDNEKWIYTYSKYLNHPVVYGQCGLHPLFSHHFSFQMELNIRRVVKHERVVAIGEIGLDFYTSSRPSDDVQIYAFIQQLSIAREKNLPVVIHSRNSFIKTMEILCQELPKDYRICWRQFAYGGEEMNMVKCKFSCIFFGCNLNICVNEAAKKAIERAPLQSLLIESVAPHYTIAECPNVWDTHPVFVAKVYEYVAQMFKLSISQTTQQIINNMEKFYNLK